MIDRHRIVDLTDRQGVMPMKRMIAFAMLSMFASILLSGCHARHGAVKPVSNAVQMHSVERGVS